MGSLSETVRSTPRRALVAATAVLVLAAAAATEAVAYSDRIERRLLCQTEARRHVKAPRRSDLELYRRVVERRLVYVQACMLQGARDPERTGSVTVPLPPPRPDADAANADAPGGAASAD